MSQDFQKASSKTSYTQKQISLLQKDLLIEPGDNGRAREYFVLVTDEQKFQDFLESSDQNMYKPRLKDGRIDITRTVISKKLLRFYYDQPQTYRNVKTWLKPFGLIPKENTAYADEFLAVVHNELSYEDGEGPVLEAPKLPFLFSNPKQPKLQKRKEEIEDSPAQVIQASKPVIIPKTSAEKLLSDVSECHSEYVSARELKGMIVEEENPGNTKTM
jgi:hypothetical protein